MTRAARPEPLIHRERGILAYRSDRCNPLFASSRQNAAGLVPHASGPCLPPSQRAT
jgi:hypothetical protein